MSKVSELSVELVTDLRLVEDVEGNYELCVVSYIDGEPKSVDIVAALGSFEDAHQFCRRVYEASLKPVIFRDEEGELL